VGAEWGHWEVKWLSKLESVIEEGGTVWEGRHDAGSEVKRVYASSL